MDKGTCFPKPYVNSIPGFQMVYLVCRLQFSCQRSQGKRSRQEPEARNCCYLACLVTFLYTQDHLPKDDTVHSVQGPSTLLSSQKCPIDVPTGQFYGGSSSIYGISCSRCVQVCFKLNMKLNNTPSICESLVQLLVSPRFYYYIYKLSHVIPLQIPLFFY